MDKFLFGLTAVFAKMPDRVLRSKRLVLIVLTLVSIGMFYAMATRTVFDLSSESFMQDESPAQIALDEFRRQFGSDRSVFIITNQPMAMCSQPSLLLLCNSSPLI